MPSSRQTCHNSTSKWQWTNSIARRISFRLSTNQIKFLLKKLPPSITAQSRKSRRGLIQRHKRKELTRASSAVHSFIHQDSQLIRCNSFWTKRTSWTLTQLILRFPAHLHSQANPPGICAPVPRSILAKTWYRRTQIFTESSKTHQNWAANLFKRIKRRLWNASITLKMSTLCKWALTPASVSKRSATTFPWTPSNTPS